MENLTIAVDTREALPYRFSGEFYAGVSIVRKTLNAGDYAVAGAEDACAIERKSLDDLANCLGRDRDRFMHQLQRGRGLEAYAVIVEAPWRDLAEGRYRSQLHPNAAVASVTAIMARWRIPFLFAGSRADAERACFSFLWQYANGVRRRLRAVEAAMDTLRAPKMEPRARVLRMAPPAEM